MVHPHAVVPVGDAPIYAVGAHFISRELQGAVAEGIARSFPAFKPSARPFLRSAHPSRLEREAMQNHGVAGAVRRRRAVQKPEIRTDGFVADRRDIAAGIGELLDDVACGRRSGPCVPTAEGYVIGAPRHLRGELPAAGCTYRTRLSRIHHSRKPSLDPAHACVSCHFRYHAEQHRLVGSRRACHALIYLP
jgi:hypothetical protein